MTNSESQNPAPVLRAVRPPVTQRSAFAARVSSDLAKVLERTDQKARPQKINQRTEQFEEEPLFGLSYWLKSVPKKKFAKVEHLNHWIDLLCALIEHHAAITKRKQTKGVSWKADCLKGMLNRLQRLHGKSWEGRELWRKFTVALIAEAQPRTRNPVTRAYYKKGNSEAENFRKLGVFIKTGDDVWSGNHEFPFKLLQHLDQSSLSALFKDSSIHVKKVALFAMRMDFLGQQQKHRAMLKKQLPAWMALKSLVMRLGDWELAKKADEALIPFQPFEDSLVAELEAAEKSNKSRQRRPNAKPRKAR